MKWFHAVGVCGKSTGNVAKMFKDMGWFVTGSDLQYFPPMSDQLKGWEIPTVEGYHFSHLTKEFWETELKTKIDVGEYPDLCLIVDTATPQNKEYLFAKKKNLDIRPFSQILGEYLVKPESIVVIGTAGKTTTTSLLVRLLQELKEDPSYMIGAEVIDIPNSLKNTDSNWSVMEGDEYHNPIISNGAKFLEFKPKYLVITNIGWEHQDVFETQERYIAEFAKAAEMVPDDGFIVAHADDKNIDKALKNATAQIYRYKLEVEDNKISGSYKGNEAASGELFGKKKLRMEEYDESESTSQNTWLVRDLGDKHAIIDNNGETIFEFETSLLGKYNLENILAAVIVILNTPADDPSDDSSEDLAMFKTVQETIKNFKGPKKRLEMIYKSDDLIIVDDFGVAPNRAENSLKTLRENFPQYTITAVFEPNSGSRINDLKTFNQLYKTAFKDADNVVIPDLSNLNTELLSAEEMTKRLIDLGFKASYIPSELLKENLQELKNSNKKNLIVFFSSYRLTQIAKGLVS